MTPFGKPRFFFPRVSSTQDIAREMARAGDAPGTVVVAATMKAGRGRRGRAWHGQKGDLHLTTIGPPVEPDVLWQLVPLVAVAVAEALERVAPAAGARVRFPNDLFCAGRKLGGILVEALLLRGKAIPLIGIGVNIPVREWPEALVGRAVALEELAPSPSADALEEAITDALSGLWARWQDEGIASVLVEWEAWRDGQALREFVLDGERHRCRVVAMTPDGLVHLEQPESGAAWSVPAAEIVLGDD